MRKVAYRDAGVTGVWSAETDASFQLRARAKNDGAKMCGHKYLIISTCTFIYIYLCFQQFIINERFLFSGHLGLLFSVYLP